MFLLTETFLPETFPLKSLDYQVMFFSFLRVSLSLLYVCSLGQSVKVFHGFISCELLNSTCEDITCCIRDDHRQKFFETFWNVLTYDNQGYFDWQSLCCILSKRMVSLPYAHACVVSYYIIGWTPVDNWWMDTHSFFTTGECNAHVFKEKFSM